MLRVIILLGAVLLAAGPARADAWPNQRITLVVPYPPGASSDLVGRVMAQAIGAATGQTVTVDNRPGAGGTIGSYYAAKAAPDGYTLLLGNNATHVIEPLVSRTVRYDPVRDFTPIALVADADEFLGVNADLPVHNLGELIALAKSAPGKLNYGSAGVGSFGQFAGELLKLQAGIDVVHVPYRGSQAAVTDLTAGRIQLMLDPTVVTQRDGGHIRLLASSGAERFPGTPDVPTMMESGLPDYRLTGWFALFAQKGLPPDVATKLSGIIDGALGDAKLRSLLINAGLTPRGLPAAALATRLQADLKLYATIKERAHIPELE
jgi:tripartite-type tricarboxylate transporter receptor subunit TctC